MISFEKWGLKVFRVAEFKAFIEIYHNVKLVVTPTIIVGMPYFIVGLIFAWAILIQKLFAIWLLYMFSCTVFKFNILDQSCDQMSLGGVLNSNEPSPFSCLKIATFNTFGLWWTLIIISHLKCDLCFITLKKALFLQARFHGQKLIWVL